MPYRALCDVLLAVEATTKRLEITEIVRSFLAKVLVRAPGELSDAVFLLCNKVAPQYEGIELGIGESLVVKAISQSTGRQPKDVKKAFDEVGDLGTVAQQSRSSQRKLAFGAKPKPLGAAYVLRQFRELANIKGDKSQGARCA